MLYKLQNLCTGTISHSARSTLSRKQFKKSVDICTCRYLHEEKKSSRHVNNFNPIYTDIFTWKKSILEITKILLLHTCEFYASLMYNTMWRKIWPYLKVQFHEISTFGDFIAELEYCETLLLNKFKSFMNPSSSAWFWKNSIYNIWESDLALTRTPVVIRRYKRQRWSWLRWFDEFGILSAKNR